MEKAYKDREQIENEIMIRSKDLDELNVYVETFKQRKNTFNKLVKVSGSTLTELKKLIKETK